MGKIQGQPFGLVVSKTPQEALTESIKAGNEAKFYVHTADSILGGAISDGKGDESKACEITINGNVLRGMSKAEQTKLDQFLNVDPAKVYKFKSTVATYEDLRKITRVKAGDVYNVTDPTSEGYPENTNFAATKDGTGDTANIWDSLGGISLTLSTADTCRLLDNNMIALDAPQGAAALSIAFILGTDLLCSVNEDEKAVISANINLSTGLSRNSSRDIYLSSKAITGPYLKCDPITNSAPFSIDENALDVHIRLTSILRSEISANANNGAVVLDKGSLTIQVPSYINNPDQAPDILCIATDQAKSSANGLYISSAKLAQFVNKLIDLAISSALESK